MSSSQRLKDERERLGKSQDAFAEAAGVSRRAYIEWEKGTTSPTVAHLSGLLQAGVDVLYIVTGRRDTSTLSREEAALVDNYRAAPEVVRRTIRSAASAWTEPEPEIKEGAA